MTLPLWTGAKYPPRRWQAEAVPLMLSHPDAPLIDACTGAGKTTAITEAVWATLQTAGPQDVVVVMTSRRSLVRDLSAAAVERCGRRSVGRWYGDRKRWGRVVYSCYNSLEAVADQIAARGLCCVLLVCDEGHRLTTPDMWAQVHRIDPARRVCMTATAYTSKGEPLHGWEVAYSYRVLDALRDGVLVPPHPVQWDGPDDEDANVACLDMIQRLAPDGPGIVSAHDIEDATWYASELTAAGVPAEAYHSGLNKSTQRERMEALTSGRLRCLVHPKIMTEGVDVPSMRWVCLRVRRSMRDLAQEVGRGIRSLRVPDQWGTKNRCVVLDPHTQVPTIGAIDNDPNAEAAELLELMSGEDRAKAERKEAAEREAEEREIQRVRRVGQLSTWCARARDALVVAGWVGRRKDGTWQTAPATQAQLDTLAKSTRKTRWLPGHVRDGVKELLTSRADLTRGAASDLLDVLGAGSRRAWLWSLSGGDDALGVVGQLNKATATRQEIVRALDDWDITAWDLADAWVDRGWIDKDDLGTGRVRFTEEALSAVASRRAAGARVLWTWSWPDSVALPPLPEVSS